MTKTLKSELKLRPTYDELVGMIESQGDPNRPPIEKIIDRRATIFRNNQFGSQFDNVDFLGLKKQEEDRAKENLRQAQLKNVGMQTGTSTGIQAVRTSAVGTNAFMTPAEVNETGEEQMTSEKVTQIRAELERYIQSQQQAHQASASAAGRELDEAHKQSLPVGVMDEEEDMPPLIDIPQEEGEEEEDFEPDEEIDETQEIMEILNGLKMNDSVKAGIKFDFNKMNLSDWSSINPKLIKRDTLTTMFVIADKMGKLNNEQKEAFDAINQKIKSTVQDSPEKQEAMNEMRDLFINAFRDDDPELIPADPDESTKAPNQARRHKETIDYST